MAGLGLMGIGAIIAVIAGIWFLVVAFSESVLWGLGCLLIPFVSLIFLIMHWDKAGKPFLVNVLGFALILGGSFMSGQGLPIGR